MKRMIQIQKQVSSPTLHTIQMVEETIQKMPQSVFKIAELKSRLPKQVNHNTLIVILEYLEKSNKIAVGLKGITWIFNNDSRLREAILKATPL